MSDSPISKIESRGKSDYIFKLAFISNFLGLIAFSLYHIIRFGGSDFSTAMLFFQQLLVFLDLNPKAIDDVVFKDFGLLLKILLPVNLLSLILTFLFFYLFYFFPVFSFWFSVVTSLLISLCASVYFALFENYLASGAILLIVCFFIFLLALYGKNHIKVAFFFKSTLFILYKVRWIVVLHLSLLFIHVFLAPLLFCPTDHLLDSRENISLWSFSFQMAYLNFSSGWIESSITIFVQMVSTTLICGHLYPQTGTTSLTSAFKRSFKLHLGPIFQISLILAIINTMLGSIGLASDSLLAYWIFLIIASYLDLFIRIIGINISLLNKGVSGASYATFALFKRCPKPVISILHLTVLSSLCPVLFSLVITDTVTNIFHTYSNVPEEFVLLASIIRCKSLLVLSMTFSIVCLSVYILYKNDKNCIQHLPGYDELMLPLKKGASEEKATAI
ncbi:hypothetical protein MDAP_001396 [Mitosporidium daphniae]|uniref:Uncharacterized protein n=1 Tax=Mitosporidium daphniae TaxID=1485682 RepID=A0A098VSR6_9MICR|nr:uncharacterized protein DI09_21p90 [Mitosporidium daphniae]KGG52037.1 hypothetical protein DI09_21p90 [Mitosporidium daphniae]|eukprot:XP_013238494.1 uncharacterized protein DI09_21p90 [Mitosporidium daphniae]